MKKLLKELQDMDSSRPLPGGCSAGPKGDDMFSWEAVIRGPDGTPYSGGMFGLSLSFPADYPFKPPKVKFTTKVYHPGIDIENGSVCTTLFSVDWSPALGVAKVLEHLISMMQKPNPHIGLNYEARVLLSESPEEFEAKAKAFTQEHAT
eukprot:TRINITY_DN97986_c0_g1_i1.p1 TRINITY_DN97986_c0_g1~~TRINITY_DN97986_c0_g1_i1.p1  ORF type:complete len:169 (+),score=20.02 TRINITY_DN97986_c0_g1_i1:62-508(+)